MFFKTSIKIIGQFMFEDVCETSWWVSITAMLRTGPFGMGTVPTGGTNMSKAARGSGVSILVELRAHNWG